MDSEDKELTWDELNKFLAENVKTITPEQDGIIKQRAYAAYLKRLDYAAKYRVANKDKYNEAMKEHYKNNPVYRKKILSQNNESIITKNMVCQEKNM